MRHSERVPSRDQNDTRIDRVDPMLGVVLDGKYRLDVRIASGGFGAIYQASHVETGVDLAVKVVHARLASDPGIAARFRREGEALTTLRSPHTVTAYELGETEDGVLYMAMELLQGETLYHRLRDGGPIPWRRMASIALGVCHSLAEAHALGIVHRDLKPTNIFLERRGAEGDFVKVLDFGIAKILQHSQFDNSDLTSAGLMIGTIDYMSPEQMVGGEITGATDLYTLGIVIYEMIAGKRPFPEAPTPASVLAAMLKPPAQLASVASVPAELNRIVMKCLERDAVDRYQRAEALAADLRRLLETGEPRSSPFDHDDDATQIAPKLRVSGTLMTAAAPPPSSGPPPIPMSPPERPTVVVTRPAAPMPRTPRRVTPPPPPGMAPLPSPPPGMAPLPSPPPGMAPPPAPPGGPPPRPGPSASASGLMLPLQPPSAPGSIPPTPIETLRGMSFPQRDSARPAVDYTAVDAPSAPVRRGYDPARLAQRDAMVRRLVWASVLVLASLIAVVIAKLL
jgi:serine/threonine protein kinase